MGWFLLRRIFLRFQPDVSTEPLFEAPRGSLADGVAALILYIDDCVRSKPTPDLTSDVLSLQFRKADRNRERHVNADCVRHLRVTLDARSLGFENLPHLIESLTCDILQIRL